MKELILICPNCGNETPHREIFTHSYKGNWYSSDGEPSGSPPTSTYTGYACATCDDLSIYECNDWSDDEGALVFPADVSLDKSIPEIVAANYRESKRVQKISPNAFAVLMRRALEALCDDRKAPVGKLHARLKHLVDKGEIPPVLAKITSVLRTLGNSGAHNTKEKVTVPMTWRMDKFFRTLVEYVYVAPARLAEFEKSIARNKNIQS